MLVGDCRASRVIANFPCSTNQYADAPWHEIEFSILHGKFNGDCRARNHVPLVAESHDDSGGDAKPKAVSKSVTKENDMTNSTKLIANLAVAIGLIGSLAVSAATPSLARTHTAASAHTVNHVHHRGGATVDNPLGSSFQDWGNNESMGCPC